jgi:phosphoglucomutase
VIEVLTGFKWIGQRVSQFEDLERSGRPSKTYIFGAEESYGYMPCTFVRDKDAVTATAYVADLAAVVAAEGKTLFDMLQALFKRFGYYQEGAKSIVLPGKEGADRIKAMMETLRQSPPRILGGLEVQTVADMMTGQVLDLHTGRVVGRYDLPASNVILLTLGDGSKVIARPSGTEPKIKFYMLTRRSADDLARARKESTALFEAIGADLDRQVK